MHRAFLLLHCTVLYCTVRTVVYYSTVQLLLLHDLSHEDSQKGAHRQFNKQEHQLIIDFRFLVVGSFLGQINHFLVFPNLQSKPARKKKAEKLTRGERERKNLHVVTAAVPVPIWRRRQWK